MFRWFAARHLVNSTMDDCKIDQTLGGGTKQELLKEKSLRHPLGSGLGRSRTLGESKSKSLVPKMTDPCRNGMIFAAEQARSAGSVAAVERTTHSAWEVGSTLHAKAFQAQEKRAESRRNRSSGSTDSNGVSAVLFNSSWPSTNNNNRQLELLFVGNPAAVKRRLRV
ncbi:hypothetical protein VTN77DRAFT_9737 [Rasamsonia byssochlamydoides]|uniref:uncharacterized protein n=1 Tax=Rasamsonia byssochlamydoides TaxID=89139 RepID=UPI003743B656